jgi:hypothetical protein
MGRKSYLLNLLGFWASQSQLADLQSQLADLQSQVTVSRRHAAESRKRLAGSRSRLALREGRNPSIVGGPSGCYALEARSL